MSQNPEEKKKKEEANAKLSLLLLPGIFILMDGESWLSGQCCRCCNAFALRGLHKE